MLSKKEIDKIYYNKNKDKILSQVNTRAANKKEEVAAYQKAYRTKHKEKLKVYYKAREKVRSKDPIYQAQKRNYRLKKDYGITIEDYNRMLSKQNNSCALCFRTAAEGKQLHVDHCHKTLRVRGLLCAECNWYLSKLDKDFRLLSRLSTYTKMNWETYQQVVFEKKDILDPELKYVSINQKEANENVKNSDRK